MFKLLLIGGLLYILYNMVMKRPQIPGQDRDRHIQDDRNDDDDGEYVDYEEID